MFGLPINVLTHQDNKDEEGRHNVYNNQDLDEFKHGRRTKREYVRSSSRIVGLLILLVGGQNKITKSSSMSYIDQFLSSSFLLMN